MPGTALRPADARRRAGGPSGGRPDGAGAVRARGQGPHVGPRDARARSQRSESDRLPPGTVTAKTVMERQLHAVVRGYVQGVGYRVFALREAQRLGLTGWVRNRPDGAVEVMAEGAEEALQRFLPRLE